MFDEDDDSNEGTEPSRPSSPPKKPAAPTEADLLRATFASRQTAILMTNHARMEDKAYRSVVGKTVLPRFRRPLMWLLAIQAKYCAHRPAAGLHLAVMVANETTAPTARAQCRYAVDLDMISAVFDEEDPERITHYFLTAEQFEKVEVLKGYLTLIPTVVAAQLADPYNPLAGSHLLPPDVYDNIIEQFFNGEKPETKEES